MSIFSAGIVWDPREPLPHEYAAAAYRAPVPPVCIEQATPIVHKARCFSQHPDATQATVQPGIFPTTVVKELNRNVLPAVSVSIEVRITGDVAEVTARQLFWNDADTLIREGSYTFGLPNGCTVTGFTCRIGNKKVLKATARPKVEAQMEFQRALASHTTAALLEQNTPEIFTSSLGNIPPNTRIKTEIKYATILQRRFGDHRNTTTLTIPTYIANRYGQRPASLQGLSLGTKPDDISLRIEILKSEHIQSIKCVSHEILVERGTGIGEALKWDDIGKETKDTKHETAIITMKEPTSWIETDFILSIDTACSNGDGNPEAWLEVHPSFENQAAMMVTLPSRMLPVQNEISKTGEILFVADRSGSMEDKMENLRSAMHFFLKGIPVGRIFNIWSFGSDYESLWAKSRVYEEESLRLALNYVDTKFDANMGGTEILPALEAIIAATDPSLPCDVVILTDGEVWRLDETLSLVRRAKETSNGAIRFFSLGLGAHVSHALVEGIAKQGGGYSEVIPRAHKGGWEERVVAILKAALTVHVHDLALELGGLKATTSPADLRSLNPFQAHRIFLLLERGTTPENGSIALTFISDGKPTTVNTSIIQLEKPSTFIHSLAARALLDDLERAISSSAPYQPEACLGTERGEAGLSRLAESIACKYILPSKWTSLFLLEKDDEALAGEAASSTVNKFAIPLDEDGFLQKRCGVDLFSPWKRCKEVVSPETETQSPRKVRAAKCAAKCASKRASKRASKHASPPASPGPDYLGVTDSDHFPNIPNRSQCYSPFSGITHAKLDAEKEFVSIILSHQAFDGSIGSEVLNELPEVARDIISTLKNWLCEKMNLEDPVLNLVANTALIVEILERDYKDYKDLWIMIREKAHEYIGLQVHLLNLKDGLLEYSRERLEQFWLKRSATTSSPTTEIGKNRRYVNAEDEGVTDFDPVLVHEAPIDD
ncbi:von Willebrand factor type A domain-containing protein [Ustulina deusta]|nr:von Willebrand factor type A domain-containing protein [Ustulina deusta]